MVMIRRWYDGDDGGAADGDGHVNTAPGPWRAEREREVNCPSLLIL